MSKRGSKWTGMKPEKKFSELDPSGSKLIKQRLLTVDHTQTLTKRTTSSATQRKKWGKYNEPSMPKFNLPKIEDD